MTDQATLSKQFGIDDEFAGATATGEGMPKAPPAEPPAPVFRREIDLGDGSGVQVFEADSADALIEKLIEAQRNATLKIRQQEQALKKSRARPRRATQPPAPPKREQPRLSADELAELAAGLYRDPAAALPKLMQAATGLVPDELVEAVETSRVVRRMLTEQEAAEQFVLDNEDYYPSPKNYRALTKFLADEELDVSAENLQYAYDNLKASGLLEAAPAPPQAPTAPAPQPETRGQVETPAPKKAVATGLSTRSTERAPDADLAMPTDEELESLPLDKARDRIVAALNAAKRSAAPRQ